ncbi:hypothetical protein AKJ64_00600 [candidate division MSBL1 archaeon SCGC-AAA259E17]|uniref:DisA/LigA helix-hairpin-helix motif domain-containing protein n=1 Tax=candidate division MSBL1 archaeon SCGC-AAA259E17 TaxID=1698263 RepID=A0A133UGS9_9EURY|nr:hypothetical protein AKJ64_00600 [candidate division MSBL1 archaeon SCGC-AAA259E17]
MVVTFVMVRTFGFSTADLASFPYAFRVPLSAGRGNGPNPAQHFTLEELEDAERGELGEVEDIGPEVPDSIRSFFQNERNLRTIL